uniref:Uncharacterized protein n=1 Tax=Phlebotomus papatasi TaxID=29031 RepID=A0A1B0D4L6_PHLPP
MEVEVNSSVQPDDTFSATTKKRQSWQSFAEYTIVRVNVGACIFYLLSFLAYMQHVEWREKSDHRHWAALVGSFAAASLAVLCKETAITALVICALYDILKALSGFHDKMLDNDFWGTPLTDSGSHGSFRPLCVLSFRLNHLLGGFRPFGYHLTNVLLHAVATGLVLKLARQLLAPGWGPAVTGALFAAHPIHTEAVASVVGRAV